MFCPNCGAKLNGNEDFCPNCGTNLSNVKNLNAKQESLSQPKKTKNTKLLIIVIISLLIVALVVFILLFTRKKDNSKYGNIKSASIDELMEMSSVYNFDKFSNKKLPSIISKSKSKNRENGDLYYKEIKNSKFLTKNTFYRKKNFSLNKNSATTNKTGIEAFYVGNIIKYLWRYESKTGLEDIKKEA